MGGEGTQRPRGSRRVAGLALSAGLLMAGVLPAMDCRARELLATTARVYQQMESGFVMKAEIWLRQMDPKAQGLVGRETRRRYRLIHSEEGFRVDLLGRRADEVIARAWRRGMVALWVSGEATRLWAEAPETDPATAETRRVLSERRDTLYTRFASLENTQPQIVSARPSRCKVSGESRTCCKIELSSRPGSRSHWRGALWIDPRTGLVWRATLLAITGEGYTVEEEVTWLEIRRTPEVGPSDLDLAPPPSLPRALRFEDRFPQ